MIVKHTVFVDSSYISGTYHSRINAYRTQAGLAGMCMEESFFPLPKKGTDANKRYIHEREANLFKQLRGLTLPKSFQQRLHEFTPTLTSVSLVANRMEAVLAFKPYVDEHDSWEGVTCRIMFFKKSMKTPFFEIGFFYDGDQGCPGKQWMIGCGGVSIIGDAGPDEKDIAQRLSKCLRP